MTSRAILLLLLIILIQHETDGWRRRRRRRRQPPPCGPTNCQVGQWSQWSGCTTPCGNSGTQSRSRGIIRQASCGGSCPYHLSERRACNRNACQNGGTPAATYCKCKPGYAGTCCQVVIPTTPPTTAPTTVPTTAPTVAPTTASVSRSCGGGYLPNTKCVRDYYKVGAFKDLNRNRALPVLLLTDRDCSSKKSDGHRLDWHKFDDSMHSLACRCAALVKAKGWTVFGLQNYGECWSGPSVEQTYNKHGSAHVSDTVQGKQYFPCNAHKPQECVGKANVNYVYRLK